MARILVVDDDAPSRGAMRQVLRARGHDVTEAGDGEEGLAAALEGSWHLVIVDVFMPRMNGAEFLVQLRRAGSDIPAIVMSGGGLFEAESVLASFALVGVRTVLPKPFTAPTLLRLVDEVLASEAELSPTP